MSTAAPALVGDAAPPAEREHEGAGRLGAFPWLALAAAAGLVFVAGADALSRTGEPGASLLFWPGLALIVFPAALRLTGEEASSGERAATVVLVGLALYGIKVLRDPFAFTFADELAHFHNLQQIEDTGRLFGSNSILPVTPWYPGLESMYGGPRWHGGHVGDRGRGSSSWSRPAWSSCSPSTSRSSASAARRALPDSALCSHRASRRSCSSPGSSATSRSRSRSRRSRCSRWSAARAFDDPAERRRWSVLIVVAALGIVPTRRITAYTRSSVPHRRLRHAVGDRPAAGGAVDRHGDRRGARARAARARRLEHDRVPAPGAQRRPRQGRRHAPARVGDAHAVPVHRQRGVHAGRRAARRPRRGGAGRRRRAHRPARAPPRVAARSGPARLRPRRRRLPRHAALQARPGRAGDGEPRRVLPVRRRRHHRRRRVLCGTTPGPPAAGGATASATVLS